MVRLGLAVQHVEHAQEVVELVGGAVVGRPIAEQVVQDDALAELERLVRLVVPGQATEALQNATLEHLAPRPVERAKSGPHVLGGQLGNVALVDLVVPFAACLGIHEGAQARFFHQVLPGRAVHRAQHRHAGIIVAAGVLPGEGQRAPARRVVVVDDQARKPDVRGCCQRLGLGDQVQGLIQPGHHGRPLVHHVFNADALDQFHALPRSMFVC